MITIEVVLDIRTINVIAMFEKYPREIADLNDVIVKARNWKTC